MADSDGQERFEKANGRRIRELRKRRGLTQLGLATKSGYSERVIRKAESSERVSPAVLVTLAETLSVPGEPLSATDLVFDSSAAARDFIAAYDEHGHRMLDHLGHLLAGDVALIFRADPTRNMMAGEYRGIARYQEFLDQFFRLFSRATPRPLAFTTIVDGKNVVIRFNELVAHRGISSPPIWVHLTLSFDASLITLVEVFCDTDVAAKFLRDVGLSP